MLSAVMDAQTPGLPDFSKPSAPSMLQPTPDTVQQHAAQRMESEYAYLKRRKSRLFAIPVFADPAIRRQNASRLRKTRALATTARDKALFLNDFAQHGVVVRSAAAAKISPRTAYQWVSDDPDFAARFREAERIATSVLHDEAFKRATEGWLEPVYQRGVRVGTVRKFSDTLMCKMLEARDPAYRVKRQEVTGADGGPVAVQTVPLELLTVEELQVYRRVLAKAETFAKGGPKAIEAEFSASSASVKAPPDEQVTRAETGAVEV